MCGAYDFVHERTHNGRPLKILTVIDEYTRECLALTGRAAHVESEQVLETLAELFVYRGVPDTSSARTMDLSLQPKPSRDWLRQSGREDTLYIDTRFPVGERLQRVFQWKAPRRSSSNGEIFYTLREAKVLLERWRWHYNHVRPHSSLGYKPPAPQKPRCPWRTRLRYAHAWIPTGSHHRTPLADRVRTHIDSGTGFGGWSGLEPGPQAVPWAWPTCTETADPLQSRAAHNGLLTQLVECHVHSVEVTGSSPV